MSKICLQCYRTISFGKQLKVQVMNSFEQLWTALNSFFSLLSIFHRHILSWISDIVQHVLFVLDFFLRISFPVGALHYIIDYFSSFICFSSFSEILQYRDKQKHDHRLVFPRSSPQKTKNKIWKKFPPQRQKQKAKAKQDPTILKNLKKALGTISFTI